MLALTENREKFNYSKLHLSNNTIERKLGGGGTFSEGRYLQHM